MIAVLCASATMGVALTLAARLWLSMSPSPAKVGEGRSGRARRDAKE